MKPFDVISLFTNEKILAQVYIDKEINTNITKKQIKELLHLRTKKSITLHVIMKHVSSLMV